MVKERCTICNKRCGYNKSTQNYIDTNYTYFCNKCTDAIFPFSKLSNNEFTLLNSFGILNSNDDKNDIDFLSSSQHARLKTINEVLHRPLDDVDNDEDSIHQTLNCNYYSPDEFVKSNFAGSKTFSVFHLNIHSINKHIDELRILVTILNLRFDVIAITESKLAKFSESVTDITIDGYHPPVGTNTEATKGGVLLYIKSSLSFKPRPDLSMYSKKELESIFVEIINHQSANTIVGSVYRHPSMDGDEFNELALRPFIQKLSKHSKKDIFIAGDFNFDLLNASSHNDTSEFFDIMTSNFLMPTILIPTKINNVNNTLIDNIFTNQINPDIISGNLTTAISDHLPSFVVLPKTHYQYLPKKHNIFKRNTKKFDREHFLLDMLSITWDEKISYKDADTSFNEFYNEIEILLDKHMPLKKITQKQYKRQFKPWISNEILTNCKHRDRIHHEYCKTKDPTKKSTIFSEYKIIRNSIVQEIRQSKISYYREYFSKHNKDIRKVWIGIKRIVNINSKSFDIPTCIEEQGTTISDPKEVANKFNDYFSDIAKKIVDDRKWEGNGDFKDYWPERNRNSLAFYPTDSDEVINIISKFKTGKACGPSSIPGDILQLIKLEISSPISKLINLSLQTGFHPTKLKLAKVIPIHKKGSKMSISNYRPISLLSNINKVFEKIVFHRVYKFVENNDALYKHQYGFRKKYSTNHALISITEQIRKALDSNKYAIGVFVDFQKAFDTVDHNILLQKLERYGIRGNINNWFRSYLQDRNQFVSILGHDSNKRTLTYGVPQGSVLGPLLFLLFINDLHQAIRSSTVFHFADDTNFLLIGDNIKKLQKQINHDLQNLQRWLLAIKISLNV